MYLEAAGAIETFPALGTEVLALLRAIWPVYAVVVECAIVLVIFEIQVAAGGVWMGVLESPGLGRASLRIVGISGVVGAAVRRHWGGQNRRRWGRRTIERPLQQWGKGRLKGA